jgi:hypothetical protein
LERSPAFNGSLTDIWTTALQTPRWGRQVEFEYEVGLASSHDVESVLASLQPPVTGSSLLPVAELIKIDGGIRGVLKVSKDRYEAWKAGVVAAQSDLPAVAVSSNR